MDNEQWNISNTRWKSFNIFQIANIKSYFITIYGDDKGDFLVLLSIECGAKTVPKINVVFVENLFIRFSADGLSVVSHS